MTIPLRDRSRDPVSSPQHSRSHRATGFVTLPILLLSDCGIRSLMPWSAGVELRALANSDPAPAQPRRQGGAAAKPWNGAAAGTSDLVFASRAELPRGSGSGGGGGGSGGGERRAAERWRDAGPQTDGRSSRRVATLPQPLSRARLLDTSEAVEGCHGEPCQLHSLASEREKPASLSRQQPLSLSPASRAMAPMPDWRHAAASQHSP